MYELKLVQPILCMRKKLTQEEFIALANEKHSNKYDYSLTNYINSKHKIKIICQIHGEFTQFPHHHLSGSGCKDCANRPEMNTEKFILRAREIHGDKYNYDSSVYVKTSVKIKIECPTHSIFEQRPGDHLNGQGCPKCAHNCKSSEEIFITKSNLLHNNKYDYSLVEYINNKTKVKIVCPEHNEFEQSPAEHLKGSGCPRCANNYKLDTELFIEKAKKIHKNKYDYSKVNYINSYDKVLITCKKHGDFSQSPNHHLNGSNCPICSVTSSKYEQEIYDYLISKNVKVIRRYRPEWFDRKEIDLYLPDYNLGIEFNGTIFHHSSKSEYISEYLQKTSRHYLYHFNKWKTCHENGVILLSIYDFYWINNLKKEIYKSKINHYLDLDKKIFARKCIIKKIDNNIAKEFYHQNHLESYGFFTGMDSYGMYYENTLIMCASVNNFYEQTTKTKKYKLHRICTLKETTVVGGISKLTKYLLKIYKEFDYLITLSSGASTLNYYNYIILKPRYFWVNTRSLQYYHRNQTQKSKLESTFSEPLLKDDTETSYMERLGYVKVYDNGLAKLNLQL